MSMLSNIENPVPAAIEVEQGIIGTCLQSGGIPEDAAILEPDDFYRPAHALLWRRMREHGAEPIALADRLEQLGDLGQVGGRAYLATCIGYAGSIHFLADWVGIVKDRAGKRSLTDFAARMLSIVATEVSYADLVEQAERQLATMKLGRLDADPMDTLQPLHEFLGETFPEPDWLLDGLLCRDERLMITGSEGLGKGLELSTPLPTPDGWTTMGAVRVGDRLLDSAGLPCTITGLSGHYQPSALYRVRFSDGSELLADAPHQWLTWTLNARAAEARQARRGPTKPRGIDQRDRRRAFPSVVTTQQIRDTLYARGGHALNHAIRIAGPLNLPEVALPIPPYTLGVWLGDGGTADGYLHIATRDLSILRGVEADGFEWHVSPSGDRRETCKKVTVHGLRAALRSATMLGHKAIPDVYLRASYQQRLALLRGLMDTDGYVVATAALSGRGHGAASCELTLTNKSLVSGALELIRSLGVKASIRESEARIAGVGKGPRWRITFQSPTNPFMHAEFKRSRWVPLRTARATFRYITAVEPVDPRTVQCVQVDSPDRTYLAGEEMIPTHNTTLMRQLAYCCAAGMDPFNGRTTTPHRVLVLDFENPPHITHKRWWELHRAALSHQRPVDPGALWLDRLPQGVDLTKAADRRWIHRRVRHVQPELLVVGPVYKLMMGATSEDKDEVIARTVQAFIDGLRAEFSLAVILEHHAGNAERNGVRELRPFGSSLWRRWVDFGYGIQEETDEKKHPNAEARRLVNVRAWKHPRDPRCWPQQLESRGDFMPWVEAVDR